MQEEKKRKGSYMGELAHFYFAPELRSVATVLYLGIFGFFAIYYLDNVFLAIKFLVYIILSHTALMGIGFLFAGMAFTVALIAPFFISLYSIFLLHRIWQKTEWSAIAKWLVTVGIILGGFFLILIADEAARTTARQDSMRSFVEDSNLTGRI